MAAALKVSPAASKTFFPFFFKLYAIFPIDVVLPTPFTPTTIITEGVVSRCNRESPEDNIFANSSFKSSFTSLGLVSFLSLTLFLISSIILSVVSTPTSDAIRASSSSSNNSSSILPKDTSIWSIFSVIPCRVFSSPFFNLSKNPICTNLLCTILCRGTYSS